MSKVKFLNKMLFQIKILIFFNDIIMKNISIILMIFYSI